MISLYILDAFLAPSKVVGRPRIDSKMVRPLEFISKVYETLPTDFTFYNNYDVFIVGPGTSQHGPFSCFGSTPLIWFGVSLDKSFSSVYNRFKNCLVLAVVREVESYNTMKQYLSSTPYSLEPSVVLGGDLSFSFEPLPSVYDHWVETFESTLQAPLVTGNWAIIFCHPSNFGLNLGQSIHILNNKVYVKDINGQPVAFSLASVVWAASSHVDEEEHIAQLESVYKVDKDRIIVLGSVEQMMALISSAPHIVTDRYHPAFLAIRYGVKLTLVKHGVDDFPMTGLKRMQDYSPNKFKVMIALIK